MSGRRYKKLRRTVQKTFDRNARIAIFKYVDRLCREPLWVRLTYAWKFIRGRNPHTNEKVKGISVHDL